MSDHPTGVGGIWMLIWGHDGLVVAVRAIAGIFDAIS